MPAAIRYYRRLDREATLRFSASPFGPPGSGPDHPFQYDHTFNYYPLDYERPGPVMRVYELRDCSARSGPVSEERAGQRGRSRLVARRARRLRGCPHAISAAAADVEHAATSGVERAQLALDVLVRGVSSAVTAMTTLRGLDALVFTRRAGCAAGAPVAVLVVRAGEETVIARQTERVLATA